MSLPRTSPSTVHFASGHFASGPLPVLLAAALWGTTGTAASFAPAGASALSIGAATMGFGGLLLLAIAGRSAPAVLRSGSTGPLLCGAVAVAVYPLAFYSSMSAAGVAVGTVVTISSAPVFAAVLERILDGVLLDRRWGWATGISIAGGVLLTADGSAHDAAGASGHSVTGALLGLLAGASYAVYSWSAGRIMRAGYSSRSVMGAMFGAGAVLLLPVLAVTGGPLLTSTPGLIVAAYLAVIPMGLAYVLFGAGLRSVTAGTATTLSLIEPVVAALLSVLVVGERLGARSWSGMILIGAGLVLVSTRRRTTAAVHTCG